MAERTFGERAVAIPRHVVSPDARVISRAYTDALDLLDEAAPRADLGARAVELLRHLQGHGPQGPRIAALRNRLHAEDLVAKWDAIEKGESGG